MNTITVNTNIDGSNRIMLNGNILNSISTVDIISSRVCNNQLFLQIVLTDTNGYVTFCNNPCFVICFNCKYIIKIHPSAYSISDGDLVDLKNTPFEDMVLYDNVEDCRKNPC